MKTDLQKSFRKLIDETFIRYNGCLIERTGETYRSGRHTYSSLQEAKEAIDKSFSDWGESIKRDNQIKSPL